MRPDECNFNSFKLFNKPGVILLFVIAVIILLLFKKVAHSLSEKFYGSANKVIPEKNLYYIY